jgi:trk system potassium uptake protein
MKILILGAGQVGRTAAYHLSREPANEVTVVDTNEDILRDLQDRLDMRTVAGNASYPTVLEAAGIADTDILVALTSSDEVNIVACEIAHALYRTPTKIARIRAPEYTTRSSCSPKARWRSMSGSAPSSWSPSTSRGCCPIPARCRWWIRRRPRATGRRARAPRRPAGRASELRTLREHLPDTDARVAAIYRNDRLVPPMATP